MYYFFWHQTWPKCNQSNQQSRTTKLRWRVWTEQWYIYIYVFFFLFLFLSFSLAESRSSRSMFCDVTSAFFTKGIADIDRACLVRGKWPLGKIQWEGFNTRKMPTHYDTNQRQHVVVSLGRGFPFGSCCFKIPQHFLSHYCSVGTFFH